MGLCHGGACFGISSIISLVVGLAFSIAVGILVYFLVKRWRKRSRTAQARGGNANANIGAERGIWIPLPRDLRDFRPVYLTPPPRAHRPPSSPSPRAKHSHASRPHHQRVRSPSSPQKKYSNNKKSSGCKKQHQQQHWVEVR